VKVEELDDREALFAIGIRSGETLTCAVPRYRFRDMMAKSERDVLASGLFPADNSAGNVFSSLFFSFLLLFFLVRRSWLCE
jgi:hypothetical protein